MESNIAARLACPSATLIPLLTTSEPGRPECAIVLSRSRCVMSERAFSNSGSSAQAATDSRASIDSMEIIRMTLRRSFRQKRNWWQPVIP